MGLSGLQERISGLTSAGAAADSDRRFVSRYAAFSGSPDRVPQLRPGASARAPGSCAGVCTEPSRRSQWRGQDQAKAGRDRPGTACVPDRVVGRPAGSRPGRRLKHGAGWLIRHLRIFRRHGPSCRRACSAQRHWRRRLESSRRTDSAAARALYRQSLAIAADLPEALAGLKRTPPDTPTST